MLSMLLVLFFAVTGLTANHESWAGESKTTTTTGTLPESAKSDSGWDFLAVSEYIRNQGVTGSVTDYGTSGDLGRITYQGPGYQASLSFEVTDGSYTLSTTSSGLIAIINDLHKGRHTSGFWNVTIDIAAIFLIVVALTGLVLQLLIERRRRTALILLSAGVVVGAGLIYLAFR